MNAKIVLGLGFGDEGKGITTDFLCSQAEKPIVIRFSGGQQCGHTVIIDGKKHVHSNYGSGTLRGVPSYFTEHCTVYLNTMYNEWQELKNKSVKPELYIHPLAKLTTPYDVVYNRMMEKKNNHGTVGLGVGATMRRNLTGYKLHALDLECPSMFMEKCRQIKKWYLGQIQEDEIMEFEALCDEPQEMFSRLVDKWDKMFEIAKYNELRSYEDLIFEGSQGILLDMDHGIFPHVTYAHTTSRNARDVIRILEDKWPREKRIITYTYYVTRCYQTRHGNGWMSNTKPVHLVSNDHEINVTNPYQGNFRTSEIDYELISYAIRTDKVYSESGIGNEILVTTCMDQRPRFVFERDLIGRPFWDHIEIDTPDTSKIKHKLIAV